MDTYEIVENATKVADVKIKVITPTVSEETYSVGRIDMLIAECEEKLVSIQTEIDRWNAIRENILVEAEKGVEVVEK